MSGAPHEPKIAALSALLQTRRASTPADARLSAAGRARIERHVAECATCRRALATMELYERTADEIREAGVPELDWSKMELALAREARAVAEQRAEGPQERGGAERAQRTTEPQARRGDAPAMSAPRGTPARGRSGARQTPGWVVAIAIAAAALLALALWPRREEVASTDGTRASPPEVPDARDPDPVAVPEPTAVLASATLVAGSITARAGAEGDAVPLAPGEALHEGAVVASAERSEAHLRLFREREGGVAGDEDVGVIVGAASEVRLGRMRADEVAVELVRGGLTAQTTGLPTFSAESRFVVIAAEHRFVSRITRHEIVLDADGEVRVVLAEGEVEVHRPDGQVDVIHAPATWSSGSQSAARVAVRRPYALGVESASWPVLEVRHPGVVRWEIGDVAVAGAGGLGMRVHAGRLEIAGYDESGRAFRTVADVGGDGLTIDATGLTPDAPRVARRGYLPAEDVRAVVRGANVRMQQCYERGLRAQPGLGGARVVVRMTVALDGAVSEARARVEEGQLPAEVLDCVTNYASRLSFPPPQGGGTFTFEAPYLFR